jgi:HPt (histidine-containing phosphotransfer) domain-containing protein
MSIICISAGSVNDDWQKYEDAGMNAFLEKPFTEEMLMTTITEVMRQLPLRNLSHEQEPVASTVDPDLINLKNLYHLAGDDKQFAKQMLDTFLDTTTKGLHEMKEAASFGDWKTVGELAHKLLPPGRHIGAAHLILLLKKVEDGAKSGQDPVMVTSDINESLSSFDAIRNLINAEISKIG